MILNNKQVDFIELPLIMFRSMKDLTVQLKFYSFYLIFSFSKIRPYIFYNSFLFHISFIFTALSMQDFFFTSSSLSQKQFQYNFEICT